MSGKLHIVATPIGNLEDLTPRARQTLAEVDLVAAEDTRHTGRLLSHFGVKTRLIALHDHNEGQAVTTILQRLEAGQNVALVSDAGTPLVSDPGYRLVQAAHRNGITVSPVPGASAVTAALSVAGLPTDRFCFEGFLPAKANARKKMLAALVGEERTMVFYESVHRIADALADLCEAFGDDREAFVGRELTKVYEQCLRGSLGSLRRMVEDGTIATKGEFVIVIAGVLATNDATYDVDQLLRVLAGELPGKDAARIAAELTGQKKNALYQRILELKETSGAS
jgi:16S rRNA (cytidine1402-2'-O)-methyltransferase